ncbi:MAG: hypothetical protein R2875_06670 [Desulfobacterales bacterium]
MGCSYLSGNPGPAPAHHALEDIIFGYNIYNEPVTVDGHPLNYWMAHAAYTTPFNTTGHPAVIIPAGYTKTECPLPYRLWANRWHDMSLLGIAGVIDKAAGKISGTARALDEVNTNNASDRKHLYSSAAGSA